jgi:hypothetical protein
VAQPSSQREAREAGNIKQKFRQFRQSIKQRNKFIEQTASAHGVSGVSCLDVEEDASFDMVLGLALSVFGFRLPKRNRLDSPMEKGRIK